MWFHAGREQQDMERMDTIRIKKLEVFARHGVFEEEKKLGQKFLVDAVFCLDSRKAGRSDRLEDSVDYGEACHFITEYLTKNTYQLIETAAEQVTRALLLRFDQIQKISLSLHKPWAPIGLPVEDVAVEIMRGWHTVYIGLGSNLGDKAAYIAQGIRELEALEDCRVERSSSLITTEPYGMTEQDEFLNGVLELSTLYTPHELLEQLHVIEAHANRERKIHWGPRTLDLDILFYDDLVMGDDALVIPHPDMANREFVLEPMADLAPYYRHPVLQRTIQELLQVCREKEKTER